MSYIPLRMEYSTQQFPEPCSGFGAKGAVIYRAEPSLVWVRKRRDRCYLDFSLSIFSEHPGSP